MTGADRHPVRGAASGAVAGAVSAAVFTFVHDLVISDIWAMLVPMLVAGAVSGMCIGWSYVRCARVPTLTGWFAYNAAYLALFGLLGAASVAVFDPVTTIGAILSRGGPVDDLIGRALPMTAAFTLAGGLGIAAAFGRRRRALGPVMVTTVVLVLTLGLNVSAIGLVEFTGSTRYLVAELLGLTAALALVFALVFAVLERRRLAGAGEPA